VGNANYKFRGIVTDNWVLSTGNEGVCKKKNKKKYTPSQHLREGGGGRAELKGKVSRKTNPRHYPNSVKKRCECNKIVWDIGQAPEKWNANAGRI